MSCLPPPSLCFVTVNRNKPNERLCTGVFSTPSPHLDCCPTCPPTLPPHITPVHCILRRVFWNTHTEQTSEIYTHTHMAETNTHTHMCVVLQSFLGSSNVKTCQFYSAHNIHTHTHIRTKAPTLLSTRRYAEARAAARMEMKELVRLSSEISLFILCGVCVCVYMQMHKQTHTYIHTFRDALLVSVCVCVCVCMRPASAWRSSGGRRLYMMLCAIVLGSCELDDFAARTHTHTANAIQSFHTHTHTRSQTDAFKHCH